MRSGKRSHHIRGRGGCVKARGEDGRSVRWYSPVVGVFPFGLHFTCTSRSSPFRCEGECVLVLPLLACSLACSGPVAPSRLCPGVRPAHRGSVAWYGVRACASSNPISFLRLLLSLPSQLIRADRPGCLVPAAARALACFRQRPDRPHTAWRCHRRCSRRHGEPAAGTSRPIAGGRAGVGRQGARPRERRGRATGRRRGARGEMARQEKGEEGGG